MQHLRMFLLQHSFPGVLGHICQLASNSMMPHFPMRARKYRIRAWNWAHLELGVGWEHLARQDLMSLFFLLWKLFPFDVPDTTVSPSYWRGVGRQKFLTYPFQPFRSLLNSVSGSPTALIAASSLVILGHARGRIST